jgi:hypothetical protein
LPALKQLEEDMTAVLEPCDAKTIIRHLARLANYHWAERPADAWQMLFEDYAVDLEGISETHLETIVQSCRKIVKWFPKMPELMDQWAVERCRDREKLRRARVLLGKEEPKAWERASPSQPEKEAA